MFRISIFKTLLAMTVFPVSVHSYWEKCIAERCFTIPGSNETSNFEDAKNWCKKIDSNLVIVGDDNTQKALVQFLNSAKLDNQIKPSMGFIDLKLEQTDRTWHLLNGTKYLGGLSGQNELDYWLYGCSKSYSGIFQMVCSKPNISDNFICKFENTRCSNNSSNNYLGKDGCFVKYENESLTWFKARERCRFNGGDLAEFNYNSNTTNFPYSLPIDSSWLNSSFNYWVGIRYGHRCWKSSGSDDEAIYTSWSSDEPNNINNECVCVDPSGNPAWSWTDCSCTESRQFVCLKIVPTTIPTTATTVPLTSKSSTASVSSSNVTNGLTTDQLNVLAIGLGVGIGGGVFLILLVLIIVLAVYFTRRRRKNNYSGPRSKVDNSPATTSNIASAATNGSDIYAQIVPTPNRKASDTPQSDIIYANPDFSNSQSSDTSKTRQDKVLSVVLEGPSDVYANAASVS